MKTPKYTAFVSYSHKDDKWARWLLRALETYKVPTHLVGTAGTNGPIPRHISRIFRDREELAAGACLDTKIMDALKQSQTLLVVCSPNAAHSYGVNKEIELFREIRGDEHIFYIFMDGEPHAEARGLDPEEECFPHALLDHTMASATPYGVPLAADARPQGDGKKMALMKVIAGILGINLDTLVRRDLQRRQRRLWGLTAAATAGMLLTTGLATQAYLATKRAEEALAHAQRQQDEAESLIEYMVDDIGPQLWRRGEDALIRSMHERLIEHYEGNLSPKIGHEELARKMRGLNWLLRRKLEQGQSSRIVKSLEEIRSITCQLLQEEPHNPKLIQAHIQALLYLTAAKWITADFVAVDKLVEERLKYGQQYMQYAETDDPPPKAYYGNALTMKASIYLHPFQRPELAYKLLQEALAIRIAVTENGKYPARLDNVAGAYHHISSVEELIAPLSKAIATRQHSLDTYLERFSHFPNETIYHYMYLRFHYDLAELQLNVGDEVGALETVGKATEGFKALTQGKPEEFRWGIMAARLGILQGMQLISRSEWRKAAPILQATHEELSALLDQSDKSLDGMSWLLQAKSLHALSLVNLGDVKNADTLLDEVWDYYTDRGAEAFRSVYGRKMLAAYLEGRAALAEAEGDKTATKAAYQKVVDTYGYRWQKCHPLVRLTLLKSLLYLGDETQAAAVIANLQEIGFKRPDFLHLADTFMPSGETSAQP